MANTKSAQKELRKSSRRAAKNLADKTKLKTAIKNTRRAIAANDKNLSDQMLKESVKVIDKAAKKGLIKKNTAGRYKSRLSKQTNKLK